jgi:hypothetical protein
VRKKITTAYYDATTRRASRIVADNDDVQLTHQIDDSVGIEENHEQAALALCHELGWVGRLQLVSRTKYDMTWTIK